MATVEIKQVNKLYAGQVAAVRDFSLQIADGEFIVLVGPSGCGKSTTLRMIAGLEDISSGTIAIDGRVVNHISPKDRDIAMVFQNYALYPHMSVFDNMAFGLKLRGFKKQIILERVHEAAEMLELEDLLQRKPRALSGGQRQRVALGRAIVRHPKVFLFDEPLSNLDAKLRVQMRIELNRLHTRMKCTMIYVTHDQIEAMTMGDRIVVMKDGLIQQVAEPLTLYDAPANQFVGGFIGSPPMNFFQGCLKKTADGQQFVCDDFALELSPDYTQAWNLHAQQTITLGVRPEDIYIRTSAEPAPGMIGLRARIDVVEPMGADVYLSLLVGRQNFMARVEPRPGLQAGQEVDLWLDQRKFHYFDSVSERTLRVDSA